MTRLRYDHSLETGSVASFPRGKIDARLLYIHTGPETMRDATLVVYGSYSCPGRES